MTLIETLNDIMCFIGWATTFCVVTAIIVTSLLNKYDRKDDK